MNLSLGLHHLHLRKRIHQKKEKYPSPDKWKRRFDKLIYVVGIVGPMMSLPQLLKIWVDRSAAGVSAISWGAFAVISLFWLCYGALHREKPIMVSAGINCTFQAIIFIGAVLYGAEPFAVF